MHKNTPEINVKPQQKATSAKKFSCYSPKIFYGYDHEH